MEKQGMGKRGRLVRAGFLTILLFFFPGSFLSSQETMEGNEDPLELRTETFPAYPIANSSWSLVVLVNHPNPLDIDIIPPQFPPHLVLEVVRTGSRFVAGERWTSVEYSFTPLMAGELVLESFAVRAAGRQASTAIINAQVQPPAEARRFYPAFRWLEPFPPIPRGERGELFLELSDWDPQRNVPRGIFQGRAPRNAILNEAIPAGAGEGVYRYAITVIPLEENGVTLEAFSFQTAGFFLTIPEITVVVLPPLPVPPPPALTWATESHVVPGDTLIDERGEISIPFPKTRETVFFLLQDEYDRIVADVRTLWEENRRVQALVEIRRNERDSFSGPFLVSIRREMERSLGLQFSRDESWSPLGIPLFLWVFFAALPFAGLFLLAFRPRPGTRKARGAFPPNEAAFGSVTSKGRSGFRNVVVLVFFVGLALIIMEVGWGRFSMNRFGFTGRAAVLEKTEAFRVPDTQGTINALFDEGQPVIIGSYNPDWCYVQSPDGRSGWVPRSAVFSY